LGKTKVDKQKLDKLWESLLFNQFHDIILGSSTKEICEDAAKDLTYIIHEAENIVKESLTNLENSINQNLVILNVLPWKRKEVVKIR